MKIKSRKKAFTLVETIAAALLLSVSVVMMAGISTHSLRTARSIVLSEQAWDLADRQLTMVDTIGIGSYLLNGPTRGTYEGDGIEFDWTIKISETSQSSLYDVTVVVGWTEQYRYKTVQVQTRLYE